MDLYPLLNSLRIAALSTAIIFFVGLWVAQAISRCHPVVKGVLDVVLTLPLVLPPTVVGYLLLCLLGPNGAVGSVVARLLDVRLTMVWYAGVFSSAVGAFPLMYRTARGAFGSYDTTLTHAAHTLWRGDGWSFLAIQLPCCRQGILAGTVLAFARALGEYGATSMIAGYTPGKTATISTTVYQFWRTGNDAMALRWVLVNLAISGVVLLAINLLERKER